VCSYVFFLIENSASISIEKPKTINKKAVIAEAERPAKGAKSIKDGGNCVTLDEIVIKIYEAIRKFQIPLH
jgi:hypothetical protein